MPEPRPLPGLVVAIDGPAGAGKSTVARAVARRLGLRYLDTGAMYRAVTWAALKRAIPVTDTAALAELAGELQLTLRPDPVRPSITADGVDVTTAVRSRPVTNAVSAVSAAPGVRRELVRQQREIIGDGGIVVEGRDIGTVVAPDAAVKVFLTATADTRVQRRSRDPGDPSLAVGPAVAGPELVERDRLDSTRAVAPLTKAADAVEIDSTELAVDQVVDQILALLPTISGRSG